MNDNYSFARIEYRYYFSEELDYYDIIPYLEIKFKHRFEFFKRKKYVLCYYDDLIGYPSGLGSFNVNKQILLPNGCRKMDITQLKFINFCKTKILEYDESHCTYSNSMGKFITKIFKAGINTWYDVLDFHSHSTKNYYINPYYNFYRLDSNLLTDEEAHLLIDIDDTLLNNIITEIDKLCENNLSAKSGWYFNAQWTEL